mmetsp:Transcript_48866/g.137852  ORF Transcript_48866/g.137852 Transcript_48866/m.137852 type:complete len:167 (+) Transcript_48866:187-687(+)
MALKTSGVRSRMDVGKDGGKGTGPKGKILLFNREKGRRIRNAKDIHSALVKEFGAENVYDRVWTPEMVPIPQAMDFMRGVSIMVTPHGANIGNTAFMLPGSALLEVQPQKCASQGKMRAYEFTSSVLGLSHQMISARDGLMCAGVDGAGIFVEPEKVRVEDEGCRV